MFGRVRVRPKLPNPAKAILGPPGSLEVKLYWLRFHCVRTSFNVFASNVCSHDACSELVQVSSENAPESPVRAPTVGSLWLRCAKTYRREPWLVSLKM